MYIPLPLTLKLYIQLESFHFTEKKNYAGTM